MLSTLVDDWDLLSGDERKALVGEIFEEIDGQRVGDRGLPSARNLEALTCALSFQRRRQRGT
jgi:hypothetical protein